MKIKKCLSLLFVLGMSLAGCKDEEGDSEPVDTRDPQILQVYAEYQENGGTLSYDEWLASIKGEKGDKGDKGDTGETGPKGDNGYTPYIGENGNWWINNEDTGYQALGHDGKDSDTPYVIEKKSLDESYNFFYYDLTIGLNMMKLRFSDFTESLLNEKGYLIHDEVLSYVSLLNTTSYEVKPYFETEYFNPELEDEYHKREVEIFNPGEEIEEVTLVRDRYKFVIYESNIPILEMVIELNRNGTHYTSTPTPFYFPNYDRVKLNFNKIDMFNEEISYKRDERTRTFEYVYSNGIKSLVAEIVNYPICKHWEQSKTIRSTLSLYGSESRLDLNRSYADKSNVFDNGNYSPILEIPSYIGGVKVNGLSITGEHPEFGFFPKIWESAFPQHWSNMPSIILHEGISSLSPHSLRNLSSVFLPISIKELPENCIDVAYIYYAGTEYQWSQMKIDTNAIINGTVYFYSEEEPTTVGNYWHYRAGRMWPW